MLNPEMIEDPAKIVDEAQKDKLHVNLIINNRVGGNAPSIADKIADRLYSEKQQKLFYFRVIFTFHFCQSVKVKHRANPLPNAI